MGRGIYATMAGLAGVPCPRLAALLLISWRLVRCATVKLVRCCATVTNKTSAPNAVRCNTVYGNGAVGCCLVYFFKRTLQTSATTIGATSATWVVATAAANAFGWRVIGRYY